MSTEHKPNHQNGRTTKAQADGLVGDAAVSYANVVAIANAATSCATTTAHIKGVLFPDAERAS